MINLADARLAEATFRLAVEACPDGVVLFEDDGTIAFVNAEIEAQFGYGRDDLIGRAVGLLIPERPREPDLNVAAMDVRSVSRGPRVRIEHIGRRRDGSEFPVGIGLRPIRDGGRALVLMVIHDLTERRRAERLKDEFVSTVSHELRTPLTSISGSLGLLNGLWSGQMPESAARLLAIAHRNSQRLVRLVNDILDIEKLEAGRVVFNLARVEVVPLVEQAIETSRGYADAYGVQVHLDPDSTAAEVCADPDRLGQVVTNLLSNAVKFSPAGEAVQVCVTGAGPLVRISVRDRGPGMPAAFKRHVFERFSQADATDSRQKGGTGLGLSIVKEIVERLGGQVGFEDAPGGGTIFFVDLPAWAAQAGGPPLREPSSVTQSPLAADAARRRSDLRRNAA